MEANQLPLRARAAWGVVGALVRHWERARLNEAMLLPKADIGEMAGGASAEDKAQYEQQYREILEAGSNPAPTLVEV